MGSGFCLAIRFIILLKYRTPLADLPHLAEQRWNQRGHFKRAKVSWQLEGHKAREEKRPTVPISLVSPR